MINGIEGQFGSGKSSLATFIAFEVSKITKKVWSKGKNDGINIILSNIKMDKLSLPNYYYFDDDKFLEILRTANTINDIERHLYTNSKKNGGGLLNYKRKSFTKFYIFFDEAGAIANNQNKLEDNSIYAEYINQNRKNFEEIYIITAKGEQTNKTLRRMVDWWYYVKPLANFPILKDFGIIRRQQKDDDGQVSTYKYIGKDDKGDDILKEKPVDEYFGFFYKPAIWNLYDDLHKNIADSDKYNFIDKKLIGTILDIKPEYKNIILNKEEFTPLKKYLLENKTINLETKTNFSKKSLENNIKKENLPENKTLFDKQKENDNKIKFSSKFSLKSNKTNN